MADVKTDKTLIDDLLSRGIENIIPERESLEKLLQSGNKLNVYLGIDPTATRIHLGHAFNLRKLQIMSELGHNVTFLIGDFTALIGDTSDKDSERPKLTSDEIKNNFDSYKQQASKYLNFENVTLKFNSEWLKELTFQDVLELAENFSINDFISRDLIRKRLDVGKRVGLKETLYPLLQGYDSEHMDTDIQFGATDQTFNMQAGRTLIKRKRDKESYVVASGYLSGTDGRKMSKSWDNAIWLDDEAEEVFGKVMSISDDALEEYFVFGTNLPLPEIDDIKVKIANNEIHPMDAKKILARQIVKELHGDDSIEHAEKHFVSSVQEKNVDDAVTIPAKGLEHGSDLTEVMVENKMVESSSDARRLFEQGAIRLNDEAISQNDELKLNDGVNQVRIGKRRYLNIEK
jgi:tyrosyl-tRNA synthetase